MPAAHARPNLYGTMFDQKGKQRQGCAVFHAGIGGATADKLRLQLYTYAHELGHCFNLLHSWQKSLATPPQADRPTALSWMNYPWLYPSGSGSVLEQLPELRLPDTNECRCTADAVRSDINEIRGANR